MKRSPCPMLGAPPCRQPPPVRGRVARQGEEAGTPVQSRVMQMAQGQARRAVPASGGLAIPGTTGRVRAGGMRAGIFCVLFVFGKFILLLNF